MIKMTYEETMNWIDQVGKSGIHLGLERMEVLMERLGHPERELKIIHVAGTNGKGSVCAMMGAILEAADYKVGRYISPTLYDYRERIQINGHWIEKAALAEGMSVLRDICEKMSEEGLETPTVFEVETALGFWYFHQQGCDYVILETGMGGRLDSTNVIEKPILTVLTSVSMDHTAQLGDTLEAIGREKAGILKPGVPAVSYPQAEAVTRVFEQACREKNVEMQFMDEKSLKLRERHLFENEKGLEPEQIFDYKAYRELKIHLGGVYQVKNACLAIEAMEALKPSDLTADVIRRGLDLARWPGRFQCLSRNPLIFVDGAHNPAGARSLRETVSAYFGGKKCVLVMGVFQDKDYPAMLKEMSEISDTLICFTPENDRGLDSRKLQEAAEPLFVNILDGETGEGALNLAGVWAGSDSVIIIFGSLSTISTMCDILGVNGGTGDND